jgi:hypothetical protein
MEDEETPQQTNEIEIPRDLAVKTIKSMLLRIQNPVIRQVSLRELQNRAPDVPTHVMGRTLYLYEHKYGCPVFTSDEQLDRITEEILNNL